MTLAKIQIVESISNQSGFFKNRSSELIETLLEIIKSTLASGEDVLISGFGKFCINRKKERKGRNPATGDDMMLAPGRGVTFKCSGKLKDRMKAIKTKGLMKCYQNSVMKFYCMGLMHFYRRT